jgi:HEAT repeat protein
VALTAVSTGSRDKDTVQALTNVLEDPDEEIRWKAAEGLRQVGSTDSLPVPALRKSLADSSPVVRMAAIGALGRIDPQATQTVSEYIKAHSNEHTLVRFAAQEALGADSLDAMIPELTGLLTDPADEKWRERFSATEALGRMQAKAKSAIPVLTKIAQNDRYHRVSEAAIASLKSITGSEKLPDEVFFRWSDS